MRTWRSIIVCEDIPEMGARCICVGAGGHRVTLATSAVAEEEARPGRVWEPMTLRTRSLTCTLRFLYILWFRQSLTMGTLGPRDETRF